MCVLLSTKRYDFYDRKKLLGFETKFNTKTFINAFQNWS